MNPVFEGQGVLQFSSLFLPSTLFYSQTDPVQYHYVQRNPPSISLHQVDCLLPIASHPAEVAARSISQEEGKGSWINCSPVKCRKHIFCDILTVSQHSKRLRTCTLNGKPGTLILRRLNLVSDAIESRQQGRALRRKVEVQKGDHIISSQKFAYRMFCSSRSL